MKIKWNGSQLSKQIYINIKVVKKTFKKAYGFMNNINTIYSSIEEFCTEENCPKMSCGKE
jgi:hypothetical protein